MWLFVSSMYSKSYDFAEGTLCTFLIAQIASAEALCRTSIESSINLAYTCQGDIVGNVLGYLREYIAGEREQNEKWRRSVDASIYSDEQKNEHRTRIDDKEFCLTFYEQGLRESLVQVGINFDTHPGTWPNTFDRFKKLGKEVDYRTYYAALCSQSHNDAEDVINKMMTHITTGVENYAEMLELENYVFSLYMVLSSLYFYIEASIGYANGAKSVARLAPYHEPNNTRDFAQQIYDDLLQGKLVIVDQAGGEPALNEAAARRIMWAVFKGNQAAFITGNTPKDILLYVEEAHNLLPPSKADDLKDVWVRTAKEGSKYRIGLIYATQEVSSIQKNILKNTANWFIAHLNNSDETRELRKFYDFANFEDSILRAQNRGFLRVKMLSNPFINPVQIDRFVLDLVNSPATGP